MNGGTVTFHFKGDSSNLDKTTNSITKNVAVGGLLAKGVSKAIGVVTQNIDKAIGRIDTMSNFPKVMQMFGVSADEASKSINRIDKSVRGLPTQMLVCNPKQTSTPLSKSNPCWMEGMLVIIPTDLIIPSLTLFAIP